MKTYLHLIISCIIPLRMRNVSVKSCREKKNILFSTKFFRKSCRFWDNVEEYGRAEQATDDNMAQALFVLDK